jgi:hypothetical protein
MEKYESEGSIMVYKGTLDLAPVLVDGLSARCFVFEFADDFGLRGNEIAKLYLI